MLSYIFAVISAALFLVADQFTKYYISNNFAENVSYEFIPKILGITYINNTGGAWGMFRDQTWLLLSVTIVVMLVCIALLLKYGLKNKLMFWAINLILSGGVGNLIDRVARQGHVRDFLDLRFMEYPVFNIADCAIVIGAGLLILYFVIDMLNENKEKRMIKLEQESSDNENI